MADIFKTVSEAAGIIRGKKHGTAGEAWRGKAPSKKNPSRKKSSSSSKPKTTRKTAAQKTAENRSAAEAAAKAQGFTRTSRGTYVKTDVAESAKRSAATKAPAKPSIGSAMKTLGVKPKAKAGKKVKANKKRQRQISRELFGTKKANKRNAKRRVKGNK